MKRRSSMKKINKYVMSAKIGYIAASLLMLVIGVIFIALPETSLAAICRILGIMALICGIIKLAGFFSRDLYRLAFQYDLAFGILLCTIGIIAIAKPAKVISAANLAAGIVIIADGLFKIQTAIDSKRFGLKKWWLIAVFAVLSFAAGIILVVNPLRAAAAMTVVLGISLLTDGLLNFCVALFALKAEDDRYSTYKDAEFNDDNN